MRHLREAVDRAGDRLLGLLLPELEAGACCPEHGSFCRCGCQGHPNCYCIYNCNCGCTCTGRNF